MVLSKKITCWVCVKKSTLASCGDSLRRRDWRGRGQGRDHHCLLAQKMQMTQNRGMEVEWADPDLRG